MLAPPPNSIVDESGRIEPAVTAARQRGVWFDVGNGQTGHIRWDTVETIVKARFWPDTFSTDWNTNSRQTGVIDLPNCMSKLLGYGMTVPDAVARVTVNASRIFPVFKDRGTLKVGAPADVAVLELREGAFEFLDNFKGTITGAETVSVCDRPRRQARDIRRTVIVGWHPASPVQHIHHRRQLVRLAIVLLVSIVLVATCIRRATLRNPQRRPRLRRWSTLGHDAARRPAPGTVVGNGPQGTRTIVQIVSGRFEGPRLKAAVSNTMSNE